MKKKIHINYGKVGVMANELTNVWNMGFHKFDCDLDRIFRLVYFKNKNARYYCEIVIPIKEEMPQTDCAWK